MSAESPALARLLLKEEIEELLYREAELLDERRFEDWLDLKIILDQSVLLVKNLTFFF